MKKRILIIDDEIAICTSLSLALEDEYNVEAVTDPLKGITLIMEKHFDLCMLDLKIGEYNGIDILKKIREIDKKIIVIIMTAYGSISSSVEAMQNGAYNYLTKPLDLRELYIVINQALEYQNLNEKVEYLSQELENKYIYNGLIGRSQLMKDVYKFIDRVKDVDTSVIITGESGTGKELVARAIHFSGKRKKERFEEINCAAIPESLLEEELFGHKKGSFTGAIEDRKGKFEIANNGTIFLDEIGDMPLSLQAKLLRVLEQKEYTSIGSNEKEKLNIRFISATNKNLKELVQKGEFREDLYFRVNVIEIKLPSLRDKRQDLPLLFNHFIQKYNKELNKNVKGLSREVEKLLLDYNYPGNVRELSNIIEYAMVLSTTDIIEIEDLPEEVKKSKKPVIRDNNIYLEDLVGLTINEIEKKIIEASLIRNAGNKKKTAEMLGISDKGLWNKINRYKLQS